MKLDAPRAHPGAKGLKAAVAAGQDHAAGRRLDLVGVPLEPGEAPRNVTEERVRRLRLELHLPPADLGLGGGARPAPRRLGQKLRAQAHAEHRGTARGELGQELLLGPQPRVLTLVVDVHGAA